MSRGLSPRGGSQVIVVSACIDGSHDGARCLLRLSSLGCVHQGRSPFLGLTRDADEQKKRSSSSGGLTGSLRSFLPFSLFFLLFRLGIDRLGKSKLTPAILFPFFLVCLPAARPLVRPSGFPTPALLYSFHQKHPLCELTSLSV